MATTDSAPLVGLSAWQVERLSRGLDAGRISKRSKGGTTLDYVEGHDCIRAANEIFGFAGWSRHTPEMRLVAEQPYSAKGRDGWLAAYIAHTFIRVVTEAGAIETDGWGYGEGIDYSNPGLAHESAVKEAETDATKRALIKFGDQFGLALYDKAKEHVEGGNGNGSGRANSQPPARQQAANGRGLSGRMQPVSPPQSPAAPAEAEAIKAALLAAVKAAGIPNDLVKAFLTESGIAWPYPEAAIAPLANWIGAQNADAGAQFVAAILRAGLRVPGESLSPALRQPDQPQYDEDGVSMYSMDPADDGRYDG